jgi:hypothetical protein
MNPRYPRVAQRAAHLCEYCRAPEALFNFPFEVEHIVPSVRGGLDQECNLALSCRSCNLRKSTHIDRFDPEAQSPARLFNPRADRWIDHFRVDTATGIICGITSVGRATVTRLQMNSQAQLEARGQWMQLRFFPKT